MGDSRLAELRNELADYPGGVATSPSEAQVVLPLRFLHGDQELSFLSISAIVSTARDVTVEELAIESFYPADRQTADALRRQAGSEGSR